MHKQHLARLVFRLLGLVYIIWGISLCWSTAFARERPDEEIGSIPSFGIRSASQRTHIGDSPFTPPEASDSLFVIDSGFDLDTQCIFRNAGPIQFQIEVGRYPGDVQRLLANGLIGPNAQLRMPAYDVDFAGVPGYLPERDRVWFNNRIVPDEYLTGINNTWILNNFDIPIQWVNFATPDPSGLVPGVNTIRIDIDTANSDEEVWCTAIDWATLSIEVVRPVLLVHGILSDGSTWDQQKTDAFKWTDALNGLGIPISKLSVGKLQSIQENAALIADEVSRLQRQWGVNKLTIVAHSKGGLDSRHYAEKHETIDRIIQIGTPNAGSPLADAIQAGLIVALGGINTAVIDSLAGKASYQLTTVYMGIYNLFHGPNPNTAYVSLAGNYKYGGLGVWDRALSSFYSDDNDTVVPVRSVHALRYALHPTHPSHGINKSAMHTEMTSAQRIFQRVQGYFSSIAQPAALAVSRFANVEAAQLLNNPNNGQTIQTGTVVGLIEPGHTRTHMLYMDSSHRITFLLYYGTGDLGFELLSPSGIRIAPETTSASVQYDTFGDIDGLRFKTFTIEQPEIGVWMATVTGQTIVNPAEAEPYFLTGWLSESPVRMDAVTDSALYHLGTPIVIHTTLLNAGVPIPGAEVTAKVVRPDESFAVIPLRDDGAGADTVAGDGVFSGAYDDTSQAGLYRLLVSASQAVSPRFSREKLLSVPVSASESKFIDSFSDMGIDHDGDGLFEELLINVNLDVTTANSYRIVGVLADSNGNVVSTSAVEATLGIGLHSVELGFDGDHIFSHATDGPFVLAILRLAENDPFVPLPLDDRVNAYVTSAYSYTQFQGSAIAVPRTGTDRGVDLDGNGLFDILEINLNVLVQTAGVYQWSIRLADKNGVELGVLADSTPFSRGMNTLILRFAGEMIGVNGVDGSFDVIDLLIYGDVDSAVVFQVYTTSNYRASQFEGFVQRYIPGDCNSDQTVGAADLTALALEFFDGDDNNNPNDTPNGAYPGTPACDANEDGRIGASDLTCIALIFFNGPGACQVGQSAVAHSQPTLVIPDDLVAEAGGQVTVPIVLQGNGAEVSSLLFSIDYDERWLTIDPADHDEDGVPDAIVFNLPDHFVRSVTIDLNDASGELDIMIASFASPAHVLPEGELLSITFGLGNSADTTEATIAFAQQPEPSLGDRSGHAISGSAQDGAVRIVATGESGSASVLHLPMISR